MSERNRKEITVEKMLHMENAFVQSIAYASATNPKLIEHITVKGRISVDESGGAVVRRSDDNGRTWSAVGEWRSELERKGDRIVKRTHPVYHLDPKRGVLVEFFWKYEEGPEGDYADFGPDQDGTPIQARTGRIYYRISKDEGETWGQERQLVQKGHDEVHWADGLYYGKNSPYLMNPITLSDGTLVLPVCFGLLGDDGELIKWPDRFSDCNWPIFVSACFLGTWRGDEIEWEMSNHLTAPEYMTRDLDEPAVAELESGKLMMVMRGSSTARQAFPGVKFFSISKDGGHTWGPAVPVTYPDGSFVNSPSSLPNLFRSGKNGRLYLIANILPEPCRQCDPRYPLKIVEIDQKYFWALPETEAVIADREDRHPRFVRFSNWRRIEDRETKNPVIYMTESRADDIIPDIEGEIVPHSYRYEIVLPE